MDEKYETSLLMNVILCKWLNFDLYDGLLPDRVASAGRSFALGKMDGDIFRPILEDLQVVAGIYEIRAKK